MKVSSNTILTREHLNDVVEYFSQYEAFAFDVETVGENRGSSPHNTVTWLSMATYGKSVVIPMGHPHGTKVIGQVKEPRVDKNGKTRMFKVPVYEPAPDQLTPAEVFNTIKPLFFSDRTKVAHNAVFDLVSSKKYFGEFIPGPKADTIVLQWLLNENIKSFKLKTLVKDHFHFEWEDKEIGKEVEKHPFNQVAYYSLCDARYCWFLYTKLAPLIDAQQLNTVYKMECDLLPVLESMKDAGALVDYDRLLSLKDELSDQLEELQFDVVKAAGKEFNLNAPAQKAKLLYGKKKDGGQGLKPWKITDGGKKKREQGLDLDPQDYSTDADALESYPDNPLAQGLLKYQEVNKVLGTYVLGYLGEEGNKKKPCIIYDGKIHADFVQYGTTTGRFSCRAPNLQNIPRPDTDLGKQIRGLFVAGEGNKLIVADYGQIELVILAHYLGRGMLYEGFLEGIDPHTMTAAGVLHKDPNEVLPTERQLFGKTLNFATNYGVGAKKVANMLRVSEKEAKEVLETHRAQFPEIYQFKDAVIKKCRTRKPPHVRTLSGRIRRVPTINSKDNGLRGYAERQAFNSLIQGGNADIIKWALIRAHNALPEDIKIVLTVHDEIVLMSPEDRVELGRDILHEAMLGEEMQNLLRVPMRADIKIVDRWSEAK